ncbi:MAG: hypothetical protein J6M30_05780 [Bacteroidales bacterium]|nr:hypothetical protein [Bacteroidales bacterium]
MKDKEQIAAMLEKSGGKTVNSINNFVTVLQNYMWFKESFRYNELSQKIVIANPLPWNNEVNREYCDADAANLRKYMQDTYFLVSKSNLDDAVLIVSDNQRFSPVEDYLLGLEKWDGTERIKDVFRDFFGCEDCSYHSLVLRKMMVAAVKRTFHPGVKWDYVPIIVGEQGIGKSLFARRLARSNEWFDDGFVISNDSKQNAEQIIGNWIVEFGELAGMHKADINKLKSFITAQSDKVRLAYRANTVSFPRRCVFIGTTNETEFLTDKSGNRRFWIVETHIEKATKNIYEEFNYQLVDKLWAEAYHYSEVMNEPLFDRNPNFWHTAKIKQEQHETQDPWTDEVTAFVDSRLAYNPDSHFTASDIFKLKFERNIGTMTRADAIRIKNILRAYPKLKEGFYRVNGRHLRCFKISNS